MKTLLFTLFVSFATTTVRGQDSEVPDTAAQESQKTEVKIAKSEFVDEYGKGVDPFFPESQRRKAAEVKFVPTTSTTVTSAALNSLELKGISGTSERKVALISGRTFVVGEIVEMRFPEGLAKVRCDQISSDTNSVVVSLVGKPISKELFLNENMLKIN